MKAATASLRVLRFAGQNFVRNIWLSAATVSVMALALISVNLLVSLNVIGRSALTAVRSHIDVSVHFKPDIAEERVQTVRVALAAMPEVAGVDYVSPETAMERFNATYGQDEGVAAALAETDGNPFGAALVIRAKDLNAYPKIMDALAQPLFAELIEEKDYDNRQVMIARLESITKRAAYAGLAVSAVFGLIALLIVFNTIRMSMYTHKEEIGIMRLVGASDWFIRTPFYIEAAIWSGLAVLACAALVLPAVGILGPHVGRFIGTGGSDLLDFYRLNLWRIFGFELLAATGLSALTTKAAAAKYLRV